MEKEKKEVVYDLSEKISIQNKCNAGEYYLAALLSTKNCVVTITLGRAELFDLLVNLPNGKTVKIQVKTTFAHRNILFSEKSGKKENIHNDLFYAFILYKNNSFDYWILTSKELCDYAIFNHETYTSFLKKDGTPRDKTGTMRKFNISKITKYDPLDWEEKLKSYNKNLDKILNYTEEHKSNNRWDIDYEDEENFNERISWGNNENDEEEDEEDDYTHEVKK